MITKEDFKTALKILDCTVPYISGNWDQTEAFDLYEICNGDLEKLDILCNEGTTRLLYSIEEFKEFIEDNVNNECFNK